MMPQPAIYNSNAERQAAYRKRRKKAVVVQGATAALPALPVLPTIAGDARWQAAIDHAHQLIEQTVEEMTRYFDDRLEAWQNGERGEAFQERQSALEGIHTEMTDWIQSYGKVQIRKAQ